MKKYVFFDLRNKEVLQEILQNKSEYVFENDIYPWSDKWDSAVKNGFAHEYVHVGRVLNISDGYDASEPPMVTIEGFDEILPAFYFSLISKLKVGDILTIKYTSCYYPCNNKRGKEIYLITRE